MKIQLFSLRGKTKYVSSIQKKNGVLKKCFFELPFMFCIKYLTIHKNPVHKEYFFVTVKKKEKER